MTKIVNSNDFQTEVIASDIPVLVDFFATWCGPCKRVAPIVDELSAELVGKVHVVKLDIDQSPDIASKYGVMSVPTFIFFKKGEAKKQMLGSQPKDKLLEFIS